MLRPEGTVSLGHVGDGRAYIGDGTAFLQVTDDHTLAMDKAMADGCSRAWMITGDDRWIERVERAARWFVGDNDVGVVLYDRTGGCRDGLTPDGANQNQGAESTLAALATLQHAEMVC